MVVEIMIIANAKDVVSGIFFVSERTYGLRGRTSVGFKVMRENLARFNLTGKVMVSFLYFSIKQSEPHFSRSVAQSVGQS